MTPVTVHFWRTRTAALLLLLGLSAVTALLAVRPAAAYTSDTRPDLQISVAETNGWYTSTAAYEQFAVTVLNDGEYDPELHITLGGPASGVVAQYTIPTGRTVQSVSVAPATSGFSCTWASRVVTCTGGYLPRGKSAVITVTTAIPVPADPNTFCIEQHSAVVDPANTIAERIETNNTFSATWLSLLCYN